MDASDFKDTDVLSLYDWPREKIEYVFKVAKEMEPIIKSRSRSTLLADKVLAACFYTPSTRTRTSFQSAIVRLGGGLIGWESGAASRARDPAMVKAFGGESDKDTALMLEGYADVIAVRHDQEGGPKEMAKWASIPVLNGGDGGGAYSEHPTQGLLDLYTIHKEQGKIDDLKVLSVGWQSNSRGGHSLSFGLSKFDNVTEYIFAPDPQQPEHEKREKELGLNFEYVNSIKEVIKDVDVIIGGGREEPYIITASKLKGAKDNMIVMNQLPRGPGISEDVDDTKHQRYFVEAWNGIPVRMALLSLVFGREPASVA